MWDLGNCFLEAIGCMAFVKAWKDLKKAVGVLSQQTLNAMSCSISNDILTPA